MSGSKRNLAWCVPASLPPGEGGGPGAWPPAARGSARSPAPGAHPAAVALAMPLSMAGRARAVRAGRTGDAPLRQHFPCPPQGGCRLRRSAAAAAGRATPKGFHPCGAGKPTVLQRLDAVAASLLRLPVTGHPATERPLANPQSPGSLRLRQAAPSPHLQGVIEHLDPPVLLPFRNAHAASARPPKADTVQPDTSRVLKPDSSNCLQQEPTQAVEPCSVILYHLRSGWGLLWSGGPRGA